MARPSPTRSFTTELAPAGSPRTNVGYHYIGTQSTPMAGLAPARHAAVWAANGGHGEHGEGRTQSVLRQAESVRIGVTVRRYDRVTLAYGRTVSGFAANACRFTLRARRATHPVGGSA